MPQRPAWLEEVVNQRATTARPDWLKNAVFTRFADVEEDAELTERHKLKAEGELEARLMKEIKSHEAPRFGYDSWFGRGTRRGPVSPPKPPTQMTVNEVLDWQNTHNPPGPETTAIGAYQIVDQPNARTLSNLVRTMGLTGEELFTPELQDRMALQLMRGRGLEKFKTGKLSPNAFAKNMAKEWASLPVLATTRGARRQISRGQSYYTGDGINKALVGPKALQAYEEIYTLASLDTIGD